MLRETASTVCIELGMGYGSSYLAPLENIPTWVHPISGADVPIVWLDEANLPTFPEIGAPGQQFLVSNLFDLS